MQSSFVLNYGELQNKFEDDFPGCKRFILPYNYRSSKDIVTLCNGIFNPETKMIAKNKPESPVKFMNELRLYQDYLVRYQTI